MTTMCSKNNNTPNHNDSPSHSPFVSDASIIGSSASRRNGPGGGASATADVWFGCAAAGAVSSHGSNDATSRTSSQYSSPLFPHSSSMEFNPIREEDADILELGVEEKWGADLADFDEDGQRLEASKSHGSLTEFEDVDDVMTVGEQFDGSSRSQRSDDGVLVWDSVDESREDESLVYVPSSLAPVHGPSRKYANGAAPTLNSDVISMPAISEDSICDTSHDVDENAWPQSHIVDNEPVEQLETLSENDFFVGPSPPLSPTRYQVAEIDHEALARRKASGRASHRSDSFERRMTESAQFAEAVGEDSLLLKKIIEEDSSSDFDDDEIDEGGDNLMPHEEDQGDEVVEHHVDDLQDTDGQAEGDATGAPTKTEPICVSTDLALVSLKEDECSNQPIQQQQGGLSQLLTTLDAGNVGSAPPTPDPLPCKLKAIQPPCYVDWKFTRQHSSGSNLGGSNAYQKRGVSTSSSGEGSFVYRGIRANPPEITKRGMTRGNYAQLHRKAWLEVSDKHHRYGKNLRMYYKHWEALGHPFHMFFDWLDSKGEATGNPLPNLPEIPRPVLDSDTVLYITNPETTASYALDIIVDPANGTGIIIDQNGNPVSTGKEGWIFILRDHVLYGSRKVTAPGSTPEVSNSASSAGEATSKSRFHHSSFFGGKAVASAGIFLTNEQGRLTRMYPHSGHYRPGEAHMQRALFFFQQHGVELSTFSVDMQQIFKVCRKLSPKGGDDNAKSEKGKNKENDATIDNGKHQQANGQVKHAPPPQNMKKSKKTDCLHLMGGLEVACFLAHKAIMIKFGVFHQIHKIRRIPKESRSSVSVIISVVNN